MSEKRRYMRFNVIMDVLCRNNMGSSKKLKISNFSKEGAGLLSDETFTPGEELEIEMAIPGDNMPVIFSGEVTWAGRPGGNSNNYRGGVRFTKMKNEDKSRLLEYIYNRWIIPAGS